MASRRSRSSRWRDRTPDVPRSQAGTLRTVLSRAYQGLLEPFGLLEELPGLIAPLLGLAAAFCVVMAVIQGPDAHYRWLVLPPLRLALFAAAVVALLCVTCAAASAFSVLSDAWAPYPGSTRGADATQEPADPAETPPARAVAVGARARRGEVRCPLCHDADGLEDAMVCTRDACGVRYHLDCWTQCAHLGGCVAFGCRPPQRREMA